MPCNCGKSKTTTNTTYVVTKPSGERMTYKTEVEAAAAAKRVNGTYRRQ
jgi:hypothetical protein